MKQKATTDRQLQQDMNKIEIVIGKIMRIGVFVAATVMIIGLAMLLITQQSGYATNYIPTTFGKIIAGVIAGKAFAWLMAGIFLLILTPVLRVIVSIYAFFKEADHLYVVITTIVLIILIIGFIIGIHS